MTQLTEEEIKNVNFRNNLIVQKKAELHIVEREADLYQKDLLEKYKLPLDKKYRIDKRGNLIEEKKDDNKGTDNVPAKTGATPKV